MRTQKVIMYFVNKIYFHGCGTVDDYEKLNDNKNTLIVEFYSVNENRIDILLNLTDDLHIA